MRSHRCSCPSLLGVPPQQVQTRLTRLGSSSCGERATHGKGVLSRDLAKVGGARLSLGTGISSLEFSMPRHIGFTSIVTPHDEWLCLGFHTVER